MPAQLSVFTLYNDSAAAVAWLVDALGFDVVNRWDDESGAPIHAELKLDDAIVIVEQAAPGHTPSPVVDLSSSRAPVLCLGDDDAVDALFERARAAGADVLREPETTEWGNRRFEVLDPEGHQWSVGSYQPGASWS